MVDPNTNADALEVLVWLTDEAITQVIPVAVVDETLRGVNVTKRQDKEGNKPLVCRSLSLEELGFVSGDVRHDN